MADDSPRSNVLAFPAPAQPLGETPTEKAVMTLDEALGWAYDHGYIG